jgi:Amt family ammonium transporter
MTGIFAQQSIIGLSYPVGATDVPMGGWLDGNFQQVLVQLAAIGSVTGWAFFVTYGILWLMNKVPGLALRLEDHEEELGTDIAQMGETAYGYLPMLTNFKGDIESGLESSTNTTTKGESDSNLHLTTVESISRPVRNQKNKSSDIKEKDGLPGSSGNTPVAAPTNGSNTTLNLDLHELRSDEDEDHPKRLPPMTEQGSHRPTRLAQAPRHDYTEESSDDGEK